MIGTGLALCVTVTISVVQKHACLTVLMPGHKITPARGFHDGNQSPVKGLNTNQRTRNIKWMPGFGQRMLGKRLTGRNRVIHIYNDCKNL